MNVAPLLLIEHQNSTNSSGPTASAVRLTSSGQRSRHSSRSLPTSTWAPLHPSSSTLRPMIAMEKGSRKLSFCSSGLVAGCCVPTSWQSVQTTIFRIFCIVAPLRLRVEEQEDVRANAPWLAVRATLGEQCYSHAELLVQSQPDVQASVSVSAVRHAGRPCRSGFNTE